MSTTHPALRARGLVKRYGDNLAVDGIDLDLHPGEVMALLGPNGAGKTTTVEMCEGFLLPDAGEISIFGMDPVAERDAVRARIGMMLQGGGAYPAARTGEMLRLVASYYRDPIDPEWLLDTLGMREHVRTPYRRLSGGQQQRLSLGCAIVGRPELVFLDEPTAGLDAQSRLAVWELIQALRRDGAAVVLTTHLMDEASALADNVVIIDHGKVVATGSPTQISTVGLVDGISAFFTTDVPEQTVVDLSEQLAELDVQVRPGTRANGIDIDGTPTAQLFAAVASFAAAHGLLLEHLGRRERSLEDVFLELTGRDLR